MLQVIIGVNPEVFFEIWQDPTTIDKRISDGDLCHVKKYTVKYTPFFYMEVLNGKEVLCFVSKWSRMDQQRHPNERSPDESDFMRPRTNAQNDAKEQYMELLATKNY